MASKRYRLVWALCETPGTEDAPTRKGRRRRTSSGVWVRQPVIEPIGEAPIAVGSLRACKAALRRMQMAGAGPVPTLQGHREVELIIALDEPDTDT